MANFIHLTESSSGATRNSGTNGDLVTLLDWALVTNGGWTIFKTATNARVYKPVSGNGFYLYVNHDSAVSGAAQLATVRGCESASAASEAGLVDPFPTIAETAATSANWQISSAASTTSRNFDIFVADSFVYYFSNVTGASNVWEIHMFGDISPQLSGDIYNTICSTRGSSSTAASNSYILGSSTVQGNLRLWTCRSYDGTVKSVASGIVLPSGTTLGVITAAAAALAGTTGLIDRQKCQVIDSGATAAAFSTTKGVLCRGWIPNLWSSLHSGPGTTNARDTFTDTAYNGSATFEMWQWTTAGHIIVETTNTWSAPSG